MESVCEARKEAAQIFGKTSAQPGFTQITSDKEHGLGLGERRADGRNRRSQPSASAGDFGFDYLNEKRYTTFFLRVRAVPALLGPTILSSRGAEC